MKEIGLEPMYGKFQVTLQATTFDHSAIPPFTKILYFFPRTNIPITKIS
jgi:hypothetical protein